VKGSETACPFCGASISEARASGDASLLSARNHHRLLFGAVTAAVSGVAVLNGCSTDGTAVEPAYGGPVSVDAAYGGPIVSLDAAYGGPFPYDADDGQDASTDDGGDAGGSDANTTDLDGGDGGG